MGTLSLSHNVFFLYLFRELLLAQLVEREELSGQRDVLEEAARGQLDPDDDLPVGNHHGHVAELNLQVLGQFLTTLSIEKTVK